VRLTNFLVQQASVTPGRKPYPIRLTPGQYAELCKEQGGEVVTLRTSLGVHPVQLIELPTRATGNNVILAPREDVFSEVERETGIELVSLGNSVTSIPDNLAVCEIVSVGELVDNVKVGDLAFIDFYEVKQGYILANDELYIAGSEAFKALFDVSNQAIIPLANYVVTRRSNDRMTVALNGTDRLEVPRSTLTSGIAGGRTSQGDAATHILYEEVVSVGPITKRALPGQMTKAERALIDFVVNNSVDLYCEDVEMLAAIVRSERYEGRVSDIKPGDLAVFCDEIAVKIRCRGEFQHLIPYDNVLAVIDDAKILDNAIRAGKAGLLKVG
jgi:hypothetical protein